MNRSDSLKELTTAILKVQNGLKALDKANENKTLNSTYANLNDVWDLIRPLLSVEGIAVIQAPDYVFQKEGLTTALLHDSGEWISTFTPYPDKPEESGRLNKIQALGTMITYLRRYALMSMLGITTTDDDTDGELPLQQEPSIPMPKAKEEKNL